MKSLSALCLSLFSILTFGQQNILAKYEMSECSSDDLEIKSIGRILSFEFKNDRARLIVEGIANCEGVHNLSINLSSDSLMIDFTEGKLITHDSIEIDSLFEIEIESSIDEGIVLVETDQVEDTIFVKSKYDHNERKEILTAFCTCCFTFTFDMIGLDPKKEYTVFYKGKPIK